MDSTIDIDEIDNQILHLLIKDVRLNLKEIAKQCGVSSVSVYNRIKRLKELGVISGASLFAPLSLFEFEVIAFLGIETENNADPKEVSNFLEHNTFLVEPSASIGKYDVHALIYAADLQDLDARVAIVKRFKGIRNVEVFIWSGLPSVNYENLSFTPKKGKCNG
jgi:Lrp/AsnC family transcriptional regulator, regulator for asnA, asnC and gidA